MYPSFPSYTSLKQPCSRITELYSPTSWKGRSKIWSLLSMEMLDFNPNIKQRKKSLASFSVRVKFKLFFFIDDVFVWEYLLLIFFLRVFFCVFFDWSVNQKSELNRAPGHASENQEEKRGGWGKGAIRRPMQKFEPMRRRQGRERERILGGHVRIWTNERGERGERGEREKISHVNMMRFLKNR